MSLEMPATAKKPKIVGEPSPKETPEIVRGTLSSAYIESVFVDRAPLFRRCQLTSLRDNMSAEGDMVFSLEILPTG